ncbi:MAG: GNAT family N-acetyltransferase [Paracoccaceae bacterium]
MDHTSHSDQRFTIEPGLPAEHRKSAAAGYWEAFSRKLRYPLGPAPKALAFIEAVLDPSHAISAVSRSNTLLGVAGFKTAEGAFVGGGFSDMVKIYGHLGGTARGLLISVLERECEADTLLMDGIFVQCDARGLGIGTSLLSAIEDHAVSCGLKRIRLDVIDSNPRARALYERRGFMETSRTSTGALRPVFGFRTATTMIKAVGDPERTCAATA